MRAALILLSLLLLLLAAGAAALSLGAFASVSGSGGALLPALSAAEGLLSARLLGAGLSVDGLRLDSFARGLLWGLLTSVLVWTAVYAVIRRPVPAPSAARPARR